MISTAPLPSSSEKQAAMEELLKSDTFARSEQLRKFLQYVCEKEMQGLGHEINEYLIGVEVLGRPASYSPGEDATVRNRAYALRSKLQEYYRQENPAAGIRIELHKGSYCPTYVLAESSVPLSEPGAITEADSQVSSTVASDVGRRHFWTWAGLAAIVILVGATAAWYGFRKPRTALEDFWAPMLESAHPVLICTTQPVVYQLDGKARETIAQRQATKSPGTNQAVAGNEVVPAADITAITDQYIGVGTANAAARITAHLALKQKPSHIRIGNEASFADLRQSPVVTIGAFGNRWTMSVANNLRFVFEEKDVHRRFIVDKSDPRNVWGFDSLPLNGRVTEDFIIISRVFQSETGEMLVTAAGITHYGTGAAGEFLTNPSYIEAAMQNAPPGWQKKNLQLVLNVKIIDNTPGPPKVLATHFW